VLDALLEDRNKLRGENQQLRIELQDLDRRLHAHLSGGVAAENQQQAAILDDLCDWAQHITAPENDRIHSIVERAAAALAGTPSEDT
jgi:hypothetical protein